MSVIQMKRRQVTRKQALNWVRSNYSQYPSGFSIGPELFNGWRFVLGLDGIMYFANCIEPGISEAEAFPARVQA